MEVTMLLFLLACSLREALLDGGQSGNEGGYGPPYCEEVSRETIGLGELPEGFSASPQQVLDASLGSWEGWFDGDTTDAGILTDAALELTHDGAGAELISEVLVYTREGEDDYEDAEVVREPSNQCPTRYELPVTGAFVAPGEAIDEVFSLTLSATTQALALPEDARFAGGVPLEDLATPAEPSWDPASWDATELAFYGVLAEPSGAVTTYLSGSLDWRSTRDPSDPGDSEKTEHIGGFSLERVED